MFFKILKTKLIVNLKHEDFIVCDLLPPWKFINARINQQNELCKFYSLSNDNLDAIKTGYWFSTPPGKFNDNSDCNPNLLFFKRTLNAYFRNSQKEKITEAKAENFANESQFELYNDCCGVTCFSHCENIKNQLMWSYYGDKHTGICIQFNDIQPIQNPIKGLNQILLPVIYLRKNPKLDEKFVLSFFPFIKLKCWAYEKEYRLFTSKKTVLTPFEREISFNVQKVSAIYFGDRFFKHDRHLEFLEIILKKYPKSNFYKMELESHSFKLRAIPVSFKKEVEKYIMIRNCQ